MASVNRNYSKPMSEQRVSTVEDRIPSFGNAKSYGFLLGSDLSGFGSVANPSSLDTGYNHVMELGDAQIRPLEPPDSEVVLTQSQIDASHIPRIQSTDVAGNLKVGHIVKR